MVAVTNGGRKLGGSFPVRRRRDSRRACFRRPQGYLAKGRRWQHPRITPGPSSDRRASGCLAASRADVLTGPVAELPKTPQFEDARHQNEGLKGRLLPIELAMKEGRLVDRATQDRRDFVLLRTMRDAIRSIPRRVAAEAHAVGRRAGGAADPGPRARRRLARAVRPLGRAGGRPCSVTD